MIRRRLYNPAQLTPDELKSSFVARQEILEDMVRLLREQVSGRPCQHILLIGPRGMGKTTLGLRFLQVVEEVPDLAVAWQPVPFHEESYEIGDLADFWLAALRHLTRATKEPRWADKAEDLARDESDTERLAAYALAALLDFRQVSGKRLILFVENLDIVYGQLRDERDVHALRASLIEHPDILLIGSANAVFDDIRNHSKPFYEFFRLFFLRGLGREDCLCLLEALAEHEGRKEFPDMLNREGGRLETIRRLTGGNPRLLVLACRMLIESPFGSAFEDLERLIDEQTPYFKARIEELPVQARKVFHCLAERWTPMLARELSVAAKLSSSHASAQLRQLVEKGYAKEVRITGEKRVRYEVGDRFYNIYFLLRFSRRGRHRLERLVAFLHDLFGSTGLRSMYPATLQALRTRPFTAGDMSDWLSVLAGYVARDREFAGRENWRQEAIDLVTERIGISAPVLGEIEQAFVGQQSVLFRFVNSTQRGLELLEAGRFSEVETMCQKVLKEMPENIIAWVLLGYALFQQRRFQDARSAFGQIAEYVSPDDPPEWRVVAVSGLSGQALISLDSDLPEASIVVIEQGLTYVQPDDPPHLRELAANLFRLHGDALARMDQPQNAIAVWQRVAEYAVPDDPETLRLQVCMALSAKGAALNELGRHDEAFSTLESIPRYIHVDDPEELRFVAFKALADEGFVLAKVERHEDAIFAWRLSSQYVLSGDPIELRRPAALVLSGAGRVLSLLEKYDESESTCRMATDIEPTYVEAWWILAAAILEQNQDDDARLAEAEDCARRAVELGPRNADALHMLSDVLARRGRWEEALEMLERALHIDRARDNGARSGVATLLIRLVRAGQGTRVKQLIEDAGLVERMEPLWHAVKSQLGEQIEPLPAEIMDTVTDVKRKFVEERH